ILISHVLVRKGLFAEALARCRQALVRFESIDPLSARSEHAMLLATCAVAALRAGEAAAALGAGTGAAARGQAAGAGGDWGPIANPNTRDVLSARREDEDAHVHRQAVIDDIRGVLRAARRYARMFPIGRPEVLLASGSLAWHLGRRRAAMKRWLRATAEAARL